MNEDALRAHLSELHAQIDSRIDAARTLKEEAALLADDVREATATFTSPDRTVSVTARASGGITNLTVSDLAFDLSADALSATLLRTVQAAQHAAGTAAVAIMADQLGDAASIVVDVRSEVMRAYPEPPAADSNEMGAR